eukprot:7389253-Prymnesium_polylepis.1
MSHDMTSAPDALAARSATSSPCPARATQPRRDARITLGAPQPIISAAARRPKPPSPPVMANDPPRNARACEAAPTARSLTTRTPRRPKEASASDVH